MTAIAADRMQTYQPDVVLLHAGANDVLGNVNLATAPARIDDLSSSATITVNAPHAGTFRVFIRSGNGTGTTCSHTLSINAGANTFKFTYRTCFAELDSLDLTAPGANWPA
ncbi:hypothetical protein PWY87_27030 [Kribbella solani]|uniref:hypothetical protein n=1 Tax=Kribbella solani TaxID=236067 RepID=UPI0029B32354|nr:hypothetical protein [Kribbella solani]MDX3005360.1 hypothetical protein [Kribbella solani]